MRQPAEPFALMTRTEREVYAERLDRMTRKARGRVAEHVAMAALAARGGEFYQGDFGQ